MCALNCGLCQCTRATTSQKTESNNTHKKSQLEDKHRSRGQEHHFQQIMKFVWTKLYGAPQQARAYSYFLCLDSRTPPRPSPLDASSTRVGPAEYYELSSDDGRPTGCERPAALLEPGRRGRCSGTQASGTRSSKVSMFLCRRWGLLRGTFWKTTFHFFQSLLLEPELFHLQVLDFPTSTARQGAFDCRRITVDLDLNVISELPAELRNTKNFEAHLQRSIPFGLSTQESDTSLSSYVVEVDPKLLNDPATRKDTSL